MALGDPCSDWDKLASDPSTGEEIVCGANTSPATQLFWIKAPGLTGGVHVAGTVCPAAPQFVLSRSTDGYVIWLPSGVVADRIDGDPITVIELGVVVLQGAQDHRVAGSSGQHVVDLSAHAVVPAYPASGLQVEPVDLRDRHYRVAVSSGVLSAACVRVTVEVLTDVGLAA
jgi:hypothetical protein